jgi:diguanylate cyclase (GGDEF)-like protein/PAS domain S-box-containing protein
MKIDFSGGEMINDGPVSSRAEFSGQEALMTPAILVVDDEERLRSGLNQLLHLSGYHVSCAADGREAIRLLGGRNFDLVLLDINMPDISGQEVLDFMVDRQIDASVVILSGESTFDQATRALRKGVEDFLTKPYDPEKLLTTVAGILQKRQRKQDFLLIQQRLQGSEELHRFIVNSAPDLIFMLDEQGCFAFVNDRVESLLGCRVEDILGRHYSEIVYEKDRDRARYAFNLVRHPGIRSSKRIELRLRARDCDDLCYVEARAISVELTPKGVYAAENRSQEGIVRIYGVARDIGDRKQSEELRRYQLHHDFLTSLPNRTLFNDRLEIALGQAKRLGGRLAVMSLDVDRFKKVNDTFGHLAGDELLQSVALKLKKCLREGDTLARVGGDEFFLLLPSLCGQEDASIIARKILEVSSQPVCHQNQEIRITFSIGIAVYPDHGEAKENLLRNADLALYRAKETGRNGFLYFSDEMRQNSSHSLDIENSLHRAIKDGELRLYYQPQFNVETGKVIGLEALIRWEHPRRGLLLPAEFIPIAEETKLICEVGDWVLKKACQDAVVLKERGFGNIKIAINVSPQQFEMEGFGPTVLQTIRKHGLDSRILEIEITENSIMRDMNKSMETITALADEGLSIAIDDFGIGYSSLGYLHTLPLHTLKLDRSFMKNIAHGAEQSTIVTAVLAMAKGLRINFIAEGVEVQAQHDYLRAAGCPYAQGFHYSRPLEFSKLIAFLSAQR